MKRNVRTPRSRASSRGILKVSRDMSRSNVRIHTNVARNFLDSVIGIFGGPRVSNRYYGKGSSNGPLECRSDSEHVAQEEMQRKELQRSGKRTVTMI